MKPQRKITVNTSVRLSVEAMDSTDAALEVVRGVLAGLGDKCQVEIRQALEDAGAKDVSISTTAY